VTLTTFDPPPVFIYNAHRKYNAHRTQGVSPNAAQFNCVLSTGLRPMDKTLFVRLLLSKSCRRELVASRACIVDDSRTDMGVCLIRVLSQQVNALLSALSSGKISPSLGTLGLVSQAGTTYALHYVSFCETFAESFGIQTSLLWPLWRGRYGGITQGTTRFWLHRLRMCEEILP
jgi:hypothetical protein